MLLRASIAVLLSATAALPCARIQTPAPTDHLSQGTVSFDPALPRALEVMRLKTGQLCVRPTINGHAAGLFIFDTGAGICVVSTPHAGELELTPAGDIDTVGIGGGESAKLFRASTLSLGNMTLHDHPVMTTDLSFLQAYVGEEIAGVIGFGVLSRCVAEMDLSTPRISLHDPATFALAAGTWTSIELDDRTPAVHARCEDREGLFQLDTGSNSAVTFQEATVRKWKLLENRDVTDAKLGGVGGFIAAKKGVIEWIEFGGLRQTRVLATFPIEAKGAHASEGRDGSIGADLLRPFVLFIDYAGKRIAFVPREAAQAKPR